MPRPCEERCGSEPLASEDVENVTSFFFLYQLKTLLYKPNSLFRGGF